MADLRALDRRRSIVRIFDLYRYVKPSPGPDVEYIDGIRNIFNATRWPAWPGLVGAGRVQLDHGIDSVKMVRAVDGVRRPAILIASKPHQAGSDWTPWHDELDPDRGFVRYFGDNKANSGMDAFGPVGNRSVLEQFLFHLGATRADRLQAAPLIFFESLVHEGKSKGFWRFIGVGLVERAELVTQIDRHNRPFVNYVFDCLLVDLSAEGLTMAWEWIAARRDPTKTLEEALALASSDRVFVIGGAEIYAAALAFADELALTEVELDVDADTFFPSWSQDVFAEASREHHVAADGTPFAFATYRRVA